MFAKNEQRFEDRQAFFFKELQIVELFTYIEAARKTNSKHLKSTFLDFNHVWNLTIYIVA